LLFAAERLLSRLARVRLVAPLPKLLTDLSDSFSGCARSAACAMSPDAGSDWNSPSAGFGASSLRYCCERAVVNDCTAAANKLRVIRLPRRGYHAAHSALDRGGRPVLARL
jgi:hypothetical protein